MPPKYYAEASEKSRIKAIAIIKRVETMKTGTYFTTKRVIFKREYGLTQETKESFCGTCKSIDTKKQEEAGMVGPNVYFTPCPGERVYVTISEPDGQITSMTPMTPKLEKALRVAPESIQYGVSQAYVAE